MDNHLKERILLTRIELSHKFKGIGTELGVATGDFSMQILNNPKVTKLISIDRWSDRHHLDNEYTWAKSRLAMYKDRSRIVRKTFNDALDLFKNESFDFIYIDGYAHTGQEEGQTLYDWWPKLKQGGIFSGHDYHPKWPKTVDAVNQFMEKFKLLFYITLDDEYPSWYTYKPWRNDER